MIIALWAVAAAGEVEIVAEPGSTLVSYEGQPAPEAASAVAATGRYAGPLPDGMWRVDDVAFVVDGAPLTVKLGARCSGSVSTFDLMAHLEAAEGAFGAGRLPDFLAQSQRARDKVPCVSEVLLPPLAARLHRVEAMRGFVDRDERALSALGSARALEPDFLFPSAVVPEGHPLHDRLATAPTGGPTEALPDISPERVQLDGRPAEERPLERPVVAQHLSAAGAVHATAYLRPGQPSPQWGTPASVALPPALPQPPAQAPKLRPALAMGGGAGAAALAGLGLHLAAKSSERAYWDPAADPTQLDAMRARTNLLAGAGVGANALALGLAAGAVVVVVR